MCNLAGNLKVFCLFQIKQKLIIRLSCRQKGFTGRKQILCEQRTNFFHSHTSGKLSRCGTVESYRTLAIELSWQDRVQMAGLAVKGCTRAVLSCTFSTAGFQNSRNEVQALLAETFGNSSVWSQHVTKGIMNVLYSITPFVTFRNQSRRLRPRLGISPCDVSRSPKGEKVMLAVAHREYLVNVIVKTQTFCQGAFRASKTNMANGI